MKPYLGENEQILTQILYPDACKETLGYLGMQLEYLHMQLMSLVTTGVLRELDRRPNLDFKD
jgi:hypothetical protein